MPGLLISFLKNRFMGAWFKIGFKRSKSGSMIFFDKNINEKAKKKIKIIFNVSTNVENIASFAKILTPLQSLDSTVLNGVIRC